jgi:hypothetical protein
MNGINNIEVNEVEFPDGSTITSAQSLVQLDTNNIFTAFNSFVEFPIKTGTTLTQLTPTADGQLTPKKYLDHKLGVIDTSLGIVDTSINSITQSIIKSVDFNTSSGILTLTKDDDSTLTKDLDGRYVSIGTSQTHTDETIFGVKTFNEFPTKTINADGTITEPTEDEELTTKKYVDDNTASLDGVNPFSGTNTFNTRRPTSSIIPTPPPGSITPPNHAQAEDFIIKRDGDELYRSITSNVFSGVLDINVSGNEQDLLRLNTFQTNGNTRSLAIRTPADVDVNDSAFIFQTDNAYKFMTDNTDALVIDAAGNAEFNGEIKSATIGGTTTHSGSELLVFRGAGNYPRLEIYGDNDGNSTSAELGRNGSSGHGYLRLKKSGVNNNGILWSGNGSSYIMGGNLGIGKLTPSYKLHVYGTALLDGGSGAYVYVASNYVRIKGGSVSYLHFIGGHHIDSYTDNGAGRRFYINYYNQQGVTLTRFAITSDDRIKEEEKFIENATDTLLKLRPQTYIKYAPIPDGSSIKPNFDLSGNFESGLIAQEIYYDAPELRHIVEIEDDKGDKIIPSSDDPQKDPDYSDWGDMTAGVDYIQLIPYLIKSNQELHERILKLEEKMGV